MWVYTSQAEVAERSLLDPVAGFWVDYWLFLHAEHTHPIWRCRPVSLPVIRGLLKDLKPKKDKALIEGLIRELEDYKILFDALEIRYPPMPIERLVQIGDRTYAAISDNWIRFINHLFVGGDDTVIVKRIVTELESAIAREDYGAIAFLTRRLSSEQSAFTSTDQTTFIQCRNMLINGELRGGLNIADIIREGHDEPRAYTVWFKTTPVGISKSQRSGSAKATFELIPNPRHDPKRESSKPFLLDRIRVAVSARSASFAKELAAQECNRILNQLRVYHYVRTYAYGVVEVMEGNARTTDTADDIAARVLTPFSLRQPFWTARGYKPRAIPELPREIRPTRAYSLTISEEQWEAAQWNASQAIRSWSEDVHASASDIWQALECICPRLHEMDRTIVAEFVKRQSFGLVNYCIRQFNFQRETYRKLAACNWPQVRLERTGAYSGLLPGYRQLAAHWHKQAVPCDFAILMDEDAGVLRQFLSKSGRYSPPQWPYSRVVKDLKFLYAFRNGVVHAGKRLGSVRLASYLASLGLEIMTTLSTENAYVPAPSPASDASEEGAAS